MEVTKDELEEIVADVHGRLCGRYGAGVCDSRRAAGARLSECQPSLPQAAPHAIFVASQCFILISICVDLCNVCRGETIAGPGTAFWARDLAPLGSACFPDPICRPAFSGKYDWQRDRA